MTKEEQKQAKLCTKSQPETGFLFTVNRKRMEAGVRRQILTNSLVQAFLFFKWQKVKWFCFFAIAFHVRKKLKHGSYNYFYTF